MKKITIIISLIIIMTFLINMKKVNSKNIIIPKEAIRLRVLANSNEEIDQKIKMKLSIELQKNISEILKDTKTVEEARNQIKNNIEILNMKVKDVLQKENYDKKFTITFGNTFFPEKKI